jgi:alpha-N-arabinofuranosidase
MLIGGGNGRAGLALDVGNVLSDAISASLRIDAMSASARHGVGVANGGFWGIPVRPNTRYRLSFYGKAAGDFTGPLEASMERNDGSVTYARGKVRLSPGPWRKYEAVLTTPADIRPTADARLVISTEHPGAFSLTLVSLFPPTWKDRPNGNRIDLMQKLADLHPKFLRFPGGGYLNGPTIADRFDWKRTIGALEDRPGHLSTVGYGSSDGMGYLEFLEWCEDLGMEPDLDVYGGQSAVGEVPAGTALQPFVQDALDEIEYATGDARTKWGARRARDGHSAPFKLTYVEIGNEEEGQQYEARFAQFYDAIKARYPTLQMIANSTSKNSWGLPAPGAPVTSRTPDVLDEHFYMYASDYFADVGHYDHYDRKGPKIFVGEWATVESLGMPKGSPTPNLQDALGDAAWMIGIERNSDLVIMQAYAPLFVNVNEGAFQWPINLIGFDALGSYGSPSYYVQPMFNASRGDEVLESTSTVTGKFFTSVTRDNRAGTIFVKVLNASAAVRRVKIEIAGRVSVEPDGKVVELTGKLEDFNSIGEPTKIVPVEHGLHNAGAAFEHAFPSNSVTVLELHSGRYKPQ